MQKMQSKDKLIEQIRAIEEYNIAKAKAGNFWSFCLYWDKEFFIKRKFLKQIADALQLVYDGYKEGRVVKIAISLAPRAGKSYCTSLFCAFMLGHFPKESIMRNTCTSSLYEELSNSVRGMVSD